MSFDAFTARLGEQQGRVVAPDGSVVFENDFFQLDIHNADRILPEYQQLRVGDHVALGRGVFARVAVGDLTGVAFAGGMTAPLAVPRR